MLLSDVNIKEELESGKVVIEPFNERQLNVTSYDLTLGNSFWRRKRPTLLDRFFRLFSAYNPRELTREDIFQQYPEIVDDYIVLRPFESVLGKTVEFAGSQGDINPMMKAVSSGGRLGITACLCAGHGDVGYINQWTLEILNLNPVPVKLRVNSIICQIIFQRTDTPPSSEYWERGSQYQNRQKLEELKRVSSVEMMLPRKIKNYGGTLPKKDA